MKTIKPIQGLEVQTHTHTQNNFFFNLVEENIKFQRVNFILRISKELPYTFCTFIVSLIRSQLIDIYHNCREMSAENYAQVDKLYYVKFNKGLECLCSLAS